LPALSAWVAEHWSLAAASAAIRPYLVPAMIAGVAAISGIAAGYMISQSTTVNVNVNAEGDLHSAFEEAERQAKYELRRT